MKTWNQRLLTLALLAVILLTSAHLVDRYLGSLKVDLTEQNLYSLTPGTKEILARMSEEGVKPVDVKLFFSETTGKTLPKFVKDFIGYERYLRSLLGEFERAAGGKLNVEFIDPVTDSDEAQEAADYGLDGKMINQEGDLFYFGLSFETQTGSREAIEFLWPNEQENIEYEISKTLYRLLWPQAGKIGVLSSLEVFGSAQDPFMAQMLAAQGQQPTPQWVSMQLLQELYTVEQIDAAADTIDPEAYDLVVVIHPKDLPPKTLGALDEWVVRGGNTIVFLDPYSIADPPPQDPRQQMAALQYRPASNVAPLLAAWGLELVEDAFAVDLELAARRPVSLAGGAESILIDLAIGSEDAERVVSTDHPIMQGLGDLRLLLAGVLRTTADASEDVMRSPMVQTTDSGGVLTIRPGFGGDGLSYMDFNTPAKLRDAYAPAPEPVAISYLLTGRLPSAYPDGLEYPDREAERPPGLPPGVQLPPPADAVMLRREPVPEEERGEGAVLVFADVDFITDQLAFIQNPLGIVQAANDNHRVFLNSVDFLLGSEELMKVRAKKGLNRPFTLFDEIEEQAEVDTLERERQIRAEIESFQQELRDKQGAITTRNAALFEKQVQDDIDALNERIAQGNRELREIRKDRRQALERQESGVRFAVMGWMPLVVLAIGLWTLRRNRNKESS
ncbi:MAG: Gldg family protein [Acidobacteriota bacterium]